MEGSLEIRRTSDRIDHPRVPLAISSIHLLQVFLNSAQYTSDQIMWLTIMHMAFVVSAIFLAIIAKVMSETKKEKDGDSTSHM